jgi:hypothetical protein
MSGWVRQVHRWLSMTFVVAFVVVFVWGRAQPIMWLLALLPLALLALTGVYLFVLPYVARPDRREIA